MRSPLEAALTSDIDEQRRAADEQASKDILRSIHGAFREALLALPGGRIRLVSTTGGKKRREGENLMKRAAISKGLNQEIRRTAVESSSRSEPAKGVLRISRPALQRGDLAGLRYGFCRTEQKPAGHAARPGASSGRRRVGLPMANLEGAGTLENNESEIVTFRAPQEPGLVRVRVRVKQA